MRWERLTHSAVEGPPRILDKPGQQASPLTLGSEAIQSLSNRRCLRQSMNSSNLPATTDASPVPTPVPLDEVMLAMDIVDTLRHDRSTVERELDAETRDEVLIERIKSIYAGQGIAVTDDLIRNGVEGLKQDRFAYLPPKPSFALRLAQVYIERW